MVGNNPNFTKLDILRCFLRLNRNVSRHELARELELGEGTVRTILNNLKSRGLLNSTKKGHFLTKKGNELLEKICSHISMPKGLAANDLYPSLKKTGVIVRNMDKLKETYKLRDAAVKNGAEGAVILKFEDRLRMPESSSLINYKNLERHFQLKNNDILVISFSNKNKYAENGALAVTAELSSPIKNLVSKL